MQKHSRRQVAASFLALLGCRFHPVSEKVERKKLSARGENRHLDIRRLINYRSEKTSGGCSSGKSAARSA